MNNDYEQYEPLTIQLYGYAPNGSCSANIITETGAHVNGIKVWPEGNGRIRVEMPYWMNNRWNFPDVPWSRVWRAVAKKYRQVNNMPPYPDNYHENYHEPYHDNYHENFQENRGFNNYNYDASQDIKVHFYSRQQFEVYTADVKLGHNKGWMNGFYVSHNADGHIWVADSKYTNTDPLKWVRLSLFDVYTAIKQDFKTEILGEPPEGEEVDPDIEVYFRKSNTTTSYLVDVQLPNSLRVIRRFRLYVKGTNLKLMTPTWMGRWRNSRFPWKELCRRVREAYYDQNIINKSDEELDDESPEFDGTDAYKSPRDYEDLLPTDTYNGENPFE